MFLVSEIFFIYFFNFQGHHYDIRYFLPFYFVYLFLLYHFLLVIFKHFFLTRRTLYLLVLILFIFTFNFLKLVTLSEVIYTHHPSYFNIQVQDLRMNLTAGSVLYTTNAECGHDLQQILWWPPDYESNYTKYAVLADIESRFNYQVWLIDNQTKFTPGDYVLTSDFVKYHQRDFKLKNTFNPTDYCVLYLFEI